jgi:hypothetical protein
LLGDLSYKGQLIQKEVPMAQEGKSKRGLASADEKTKKKVASMGGSAYHEKRGAKGSDSTDQ